MRFTRLRWEVRKMKNKKDGGSDSFFAEALEPLEGFGMWDAADGPLREGPARENEALGAGMKMFRVNATHADVALGRPVIDEIAEACAAMNLIG